MIDSLEKRISVVIVLLAMAFVSVTGQSAPQAVPPAIVKKADAYYDQNDYKHAFALYAQARDENEWYDGVSLYRLAFSEYSLYGETKTVFFDYASSYAVLGIQQPKHRYLDSIKKRLTAFKGLKTLGKTLTTTMEEAIAGGIDPREKAFSILERLLSVDWKDDGGKIASLKPWDPGLGAPGTFDAGDNDVYYSKFWTPLGELFIRTDEPGLPIMTAMDRLVSAALENGLSARLYSFLLQYPDEVFPPVELAAKVLIWASDHFSFTTDRHVYEWTFDKLDAMAIQYYRSLPKEAVTSYLSLRKDYVAFQQDFVEPDPEERLGFSAVPQLSEERQAIRTAMLSKVRFFQRGLLSEEGKVVSLNLETLPNQPLIEQIKQVASLRQEWTDMSDLAHRLELEGNDGLKNLYDAEAASQTQNHPMEAWESKTDYDRRTEQMEASLRDAQRDDTNRLQKTFDQTKLKALAPIHNLIDSLRSQIESRVEYTDEAKIQLTVGSYDRETKSWPVTVDSLSPDLPYHLESRYSVADARDIGYTYGLFTQALAANTLSARLSHSFGWLGESRYFVATLLGVELYDKKSGYTFGFLDGRKVLAGYDESQTDKPIPLSDPASPIAALINNPVGVLSGVAYAFSPVRLGSESFAVMLNRNNRTEITIFNSVGARTTPVALTNYDPARSPYTLDLMQYAPQKFLFTASRRNKDRNNSGAYFGRFTLIHDGSIMRYSYGDLLRFGWSCWDSTAFMVGPETALFAYSTEGDYSTAAMSLSVSDENVTANSFQLSGGPYTTGMWDIDGALLGNGYRLVTYTAAGGKSPGFRYKLIDQAGNVIDRQLNQSSSYHSSDDHDTKTKILPMGTEGALVFGDDTQGHLFIYHVAKEGNSQGVQLPDRGYTCFDAFSTGPSSAILTYQRANMLFYRTLSFDAGEVDTIYATPKLGEEMQIGPCAEVSRAKSVYLDSGLGAVIYDGLDYIMMARIKF